MPHIQELDASIVSAYFSADYLASRSPGAHLKSIIDDYVEYHELSMRKRNAEFGEALEEFATLGFAWERAATSALASTLTSATSALSAVVGGADGGGEEALFDPAPPAAVRRIYEHAFARALNEAEAERRPDELIKPGELFCEGIFCTPDLANKRIRGPEEWKCTWSSARGNLESAHPDWMMQIPGYIYAGGYRPNAILRVFHVNGYYEKGQMGRPVVRFWWLKWSEQEIEENWAQIQGHKDVMMREGRL